MTVKLLIEHHLEFLNLKGGCTGSSETVYVKMPHSWKSHVGVSYGPQHNKTCLRGVVNNKGADQPAHPCSLISDFAIHCLESIISNFATDEISIF